MKTEVLDIKIGWSEIKVDFLDKLVVDINDFLPLTFRLSSPRLHGSYLYVDCSYPEIWGINMDLLFIKGIIRGYLIANKVEVI